MAIQGPAITKAAMEWFESLASNGMFLVDGDGKARLTPGAEEVVKALHEVLSGSEVQIVVKTRGSASVRDELNKKMHAAMVSVNRISDPGAIDTAP